MLIGNWTTEIITQSCFHTLYFQKYIMKKFWNSLPKEAVSLPLNSSILLWERSHLSKYVMLSDLDGPKKLNLTLSAKIPQPTMAMVKFPAPPVEIMVKYLGFDQGGGGRCWRFKLMGHLFENCFLQHLAVRHRSRCWCHVRLIIKGLYVMYSFPDQLDTLCGQSYGFLQCTSYDET